MGTQRHAPSRIKAFNVAAVYDPASQRRKSPTKPVSLPTRFPDDDHAYHPQRRVQVTKLQHNVLPPPSPRTTSSLPSRRKPPSHPRQRVANLVDSELWGFPVKYSPSEELTAAWKKAEQHESEEVERERQQEEARLKDLKRKEVINELEKQDYLLYLFLAGKYGALDAILYCCTAYPGRLYALLVDQSARKLQRWRAERMAALRKYWVVALSKETLRSSFQQAFGQIQQALNHQRSAAVFLRRLRWRFAARAFRSWFEFTQRQIEVKWRFQFALREDLRGRFAQWRNRIAKVKQFKIQLKHVARRKQTQWTFTLWTEWQAKHQRLRLHIQQQWAKQQSRCLAAWRTFSLISQRERHASTKIQSLWRGHRERQRISCRRLAASMVTKVARGFLARRYVAHVRVRLAVAEALERVVRTLEWEEISRGLRAEQLAAVEKEIRRAARETEFIEGAERDAVAFIKSELAKVRRNDTHQRLQRLVARLQEEGLPTPQPGPRTAEALAQHATALLLEEAASAARQHARNAFLSQGNAPACVDGQCVVCSASASFLRRQSPPWLAAPSRCVHALVSPDASQLLAAVDAAARDVGAERRPIAVQELWRRLRK